VSTVHTIEDPRYPTSITVACVNFASVPGDKPATLAKIEGRMRDAARQGAQLVAFPEGSLNTYAPCEDCTSNHRPCQWHLDEAELVPGPSTRFLAELAAELDIYVVLGMNELDPADPTRMYNAAALVGPEGILGTSRKVHLGHPLETCRHSPGTELPVYETRLGPIGILICYDFFSNPELSRILALKGARLIINPTHNPIAPGKSQYVVASTVARAQENLIYTMTANWPADLGVGHSTIAGPAFPSFNNVLAEAGMDEQMIVANLNYRQLARWYDLFPWRDWRLDPERQLGINELIAREFDEITLNAAELRRSGAATAEQSEATATDEG
jgi:predicted amidohydrolase